MVNGLSEAVSHDSKKVENITAYKIGMASLVFLVAFTNVLINANTKVTRPNKPVSSHNVMYELWALPWCPMLDKY